MAMNKCEVCGGRMKKSTSPFGYVSWYCQNCGNEDTIFKGFLKKKGGKK